MIFNEQSAKTIAQFLLQIKAIKLETHKPFTWASGMRSPIYCDNRIILSYPDIRNHVVYNLSKEIEKKLGLPEAIIGVATGAIGIGALVASELGVPFAYVRPKPKSHGRENQVEGHIEEHANVVVIEDLISTGKSSLEAVDAISRSINVKVKAVAAIFDYGFEETRKRFEEHQIEYFSLSDYNHLIDQAYQTNYLAQSDLELLRSWRKDPENWIKKFNYGVKD